MARVSTARTRAEARDRIARQGQMIDGFNRWLGGTAGQLALIGAFVLVVLATAWLEAHL